MVKTFTRLSICLIVLLILVSCQNKAEKPILIGAASSLSNVLDELVAEYSTGSSQKIKTTYAASGVIYTQLQSGAPIDLFISSDNRYLSKLGERNQILKSITLCRNTLVFATSKDTISREGKLTPENDLIRKIGIGNPDFSPAGKYAADLLKDRGTFDKVKDKFILGSNVRQVLDWVEKGNVDAAFIYKTDALLANSLQILEEWGTVSGQLIEYPAIVPKSTSNPSGASDFLSFLRSEAAAKILKQYGFLESI